MDAFVIRNVPLKLAAKKVNVVTRHTIMVAVLLVTAMPNALLINVQVGYVRPLVCVLPGFVVMAAIIGPQAIFVMNIMRKIIVALGVRPVVMMLEKDVRYNTALVMPLPVLEQSLAGVIIGFMMIALPLNTVLMMIQVVILNAVLVPAVMVAGTNQTVLNQLAIQTILMVFVQAQMGQIQRVGFIPEITIATVPMPMSITQILLKILVDFVNIAQTTI